MLFRKKRLLMSLVMFAIVALFISAYQTDCQAKASAAAIDGTDDIQSAKSTKILITTTDSAKTQLRHKQISNPPRLVIDFQSKNVFTNIPARSIVNRGVIKEIRAQYYTDANPMDVSGQKVFPLKSLVFDLVELTPYQVISEADTVLVVINNPPVTKTTGLPIGVMEIAPPRPEQAYSALSPKDKALLDALAEEEMKISGVRMDTTALKAKITEVMDSMKADAEPVAASSVQTAAVATVAAAKYVPPAYTHWFPDSFTKVEPLAWNIGEKDIKTFVKWIVSFLALVMGFIVGAMIWSWRKKYTEYGIARVQHLVAEIERIKTQYGNKTKHLEEEILRRLKLEGELAEFNLSLEKEQKKSRTLEDEIMRRAKRERKLTEAIEKIQKELESKEEELVSLNQQEETIEESEDLATYTETSYFMEEIDMSSVGEFYSGPERRRWPRVDLPEDDALGILLKGFSPENGLSFEASTLNLSSKGCSFEVPGGTDVPDSFNGELFVGEDADPVKISATKIWNSNVADDMSPKGRYGVYFDDITENGQIAIQQFVEEATYTASDNTTVATTSTEVDAGQQEDQTDLTEELKHKKRPISFKLFAPEAEEVSLMGSFNNWEEAIKMESDEEGWWTSSLDLEAGRYEYGFSIDGCWEIDPECNIKVPNAFGGYNSLLDVEEDFGAKIVRFRLFSPNASEVFLAGTFNNWNTRSHPLKQTREGWWQVHLLLLSGIYRYRFFVDGEWVDDSECRRREKNEFGADDCIIEVE